MPSVGDPLSDHVSLGRGAMFRPRAPCWPYWTLRNVVRQYDPEAISALPSTLALDLRPGTSAGSVFNRLNALAVAEGGAGDLYLQPRVLGAQIVNAGQMGSQPVVLAVALAAGVLHLPDGDGAGGGTAPAAGAGAAQGARAHPADRCATSWGYRR